MDAAKVSSSSRWCVRWWMNKSMHGWIDTCMDRWINWLMDSWMNRWVDRFHLLSPKKFQHCFFKLLLIMMIITTIIIIIITIIIIAIIIIIFIIISSTSCCMKRQNCNDRKSWLSVKDSQVPVINYYGIITPLGNINFLDETYRTCSMSNYLDVYSYCPWPGLPWCVLVLWWSGLPWCVLVLWLTWPWCVVLVLFVTWATVMCTRTACDLGYHDLLTIYALS